MKFTAENKFFFSPERDEVVLHERQDLGVQVLVPGEHLERLVDQPVDVGQVVHGDAALPLRLLEAGLQQVAEVLDGVVAVLVQRPQQLLQALLHPVSVGSGRGVERVGEARHGQLLLLVDLGDYALLVHGLQLALLRLGLLLQRLDSALEALRHLALEVLRGADVAGAHVLVLLLQVGPVLHHLVKGIV